jgi:hypothetical protein
MLKFLLLALNAAVALALLPIAYAASLLPESGQEFSDWYAARCVGSWRAFWKRS